jgi:hypothetical protein
MKRWKSAEFGAKRLSPEIQTKRHCRLIVRRSVTLIGTAPDAAKYSSARFLFGAFASMGNVDSGSRRQTARENSVEGPNSASTKALWIP